MSSDEELFYRHEAEERRIREANSQLAVLRARQRMRDVAVSEENASSIFPMPTTLKSVFESGPNPAALTPRGSFIDDSTWGGHEYSIYSPTPAQEMFHRVISQMRPPQSKMDSQRYSTAELSETGTFSIQNLRESRRTHGARW
jgi:hypothetical protein